jgi:glycosyltransferase involved in cell wall biosynthesis
MKPNINILWISHGSTLNGAERVFYEGLKSLKSLEYDLEAIFPENGPLIPLCSELTDKISIIDLPWWIDRGNEINLINKFKLFIKLIKSTTKIAKYILKNKPSIIITNTIAIPSGAFAAFLLGKKHIWYIHEFGKEDHNFNFIYGNWISTKLISLTSKNIIVNSIAVEEKYKQYIKVKKLNVVYCAVDVEYPSMKTELITGFNQDRFLNVIIFGRVSPSKGQIEAVKAIEELVKIKKYYITLTILGADNDKYSDEIRNYIYENELNDFITVINFIQDPLSIVSGKDLCINCSVKEAFGLITVESMKLGKPIIASNSGGNVELIENMKNGLLYDQGSFKSLSNKIEYFYLNPEKIKNMGEYAFKWANEKFNLTKYQHDLNEIILLNLN